MSSQIMNREDGFAIVYGGAVLGGGGGGIISRGLEIAKTATSLGQIELRSIDNFDDHELIVTVSGVGAPTATQRFYLPIDEIKATTRLIENLKSEVAGLIPCENGATAGIAGWLSSAALGFPMVDAPANGRAHPTGLMGAMGAHKLPAYRSVQAASGGDPREGRYISLIVEGSLETNAKVIRAASVQAGGIVQVARDPLPASYIRDHAAVGATSQALSIGRKIMGKMGASADVVINTVLEETSGCIAVTGRIIDLQTDSSSGYTIGRCNIDSGETASISIMNEYMALDLADRRVATFPTLITLMSMNTGFPIASSELRDGMEVAVLVVEREHLILGAGVKDPQSIAEAEKILGLELA